MWNICQVSINVVQQQKNKPKLCSVHTSTKGGVTCPVDYSKTTALHHRLLNKYRTIKAKSMWTVIGHCSTSYSTAWALICCCNRLSKLRHAQMLQNIPQPKARPHSFCHTVYVRGKSDVIITSFFCHYIIMISMDKITDEWEKCTCLQFLI